jgi:hypothetical protein
MPARSLETGLARVTLAMLIIYVPAETWVSLAEGLLSPFYIIDAIAMALLLYGALHSLRARPRRAPGILCGAYGWTAANGWRATADRWSHLAEGGELAYGPLELYVVGCATALAIAGFLIAMYLAASSAQDDAGARARL